MTRMRRAFEALVSGCIVYGLMAACSSNKGMMASSSTMGGGATAHGGHPTTGGSGGTMGMGGTGTGAEEGGILDALMDPVSEAMAGIENPQSGTRLKGKYMMGSDGSKQYQLVVNEFDVQDYPPYTGTGAPQGRGVQPVWYDSMLMADCTFYPAADGKLRCLPGHQVVPGMTYGVVYLDNQCTQPAFAMKQTGFGCTAYSIPPYVMATASLPPPGACPTTTSMPSPVHVYQTGAALTPQPSTYYLVENNGMGGLSCSPVSQQGVLYALTEVAASAFVEGTTGIDP